MALEFEASSFKVCNAATKFDCCQSPEAGTSLSGGLKLITCTTLSKVCGQPTAVMPSRVAFGNGDNVGLLELGRMLWKRVSGTLLDPIGVPDEKGRMEAPD